VKSDWPLCQSINEGHIVSDKSLSGQTACSVGYLELGRCIDSRRYYWELWNGSNDPGIDNTPAYRMLGDFRVCDPHDPGEPHLACWICTGDPADVGGWCPVNEPKQRGTGTKRSSPLVGTRHVEPWTRPPMAGRTLDFLTVARGASPARVLQARPPDPRRRFFARVGQPKQKKGKEPWNLFDLICARL
jgi:hypothetical protein